jgi:hypothetical protein
MVAQTYNPSYLGGRDQEDQGQPRQKDSKTPSQPICGCGDTYLSFQVVECLCNRHKAWSSNPNTIKKELVITVAPLSAFSGSAPQPSLHIQHKLCCQFMLELPNCRLSELAWIHCHEAAVAWHSGPPEPQCYSQ